jgi:hypothetical protein
MQAAEIADLKIFGTVEILALSLPEQENTVITWEKMNIQTINHRLKIC